MAGPIFNSHAGNKLAKALAMTGGIDLETAGTLLNADYLRSKMAGDAVTADYHRAAARKENAEADIKQQQFKSYEEAPQALLKNAALQSGVDVPALSGYLEQLTTPGSQYTAPAGDGVGPPSPRSEVARNLESTPPLGVQRGMGEYLRAMGSTKPNSADDLARAAEQGNLAQRTGMGTDAAAGGDLELIQNLRELTHNPTPDPTERGQLGTLKGLMDELKLPESERNTFLGRFLDKLTSRADGKDTQNRLQQLTEVANRRWPNDPVKRDEEIWTGLVSDPTMQQILARMIGPSLVIPQSPSGASPAAPASPAVSAPRPGEVSGKVKQPPPRTPPGVPPGSAWSESRQQWRSPDQKQFFDAAGRPVK